MLPDEIESLAASGQLLKVPAVGKAIAGKVQQLLTTGQMEFLEELRRAVPPGVRELTQVPGLGAKTAALLFARLGIASLDQLELAARQGQLRDLPGVGVRKEALILESLTKFRDRIRRVPVGAVRPVAEALADFLRRHPAVRQAGVAGSIRRRQETVEDIDLAAASETPEAVIEALLQLSIAGDVTERAPGQVRFTTSLGRTVDVVVVPPAEYALTLMRMTGSSEHLRALGPLPQQAESEEAVYAALGLPYIVPELRENLGEIEAARGGRLPGLITVADLRGDLHVHTRASDGTATLLEMAEGARALGHQYLAICDHSPSLAVAGGLSVERMRTHVAEIKKLNQLLKGIRLLCGAEVDILKDGSLDYPDAVLAELDVVVASIHSHMNLDATVQTERLLRAIASPHVDIIGHPTGRVLARRDPYPLEFERVVEACAVTGTALEISASPARLDLSDVHARLAIGRGVKLVINTDAHSVPELGLLEHGVGQARRAWVEPGHVVNAMGLDELLAWLSKEKNA